MDDGKMISLRMGNDEIEDMDAFLQKHQELGGRSLFIRTAIRTYIDRDADVPQPKTKGNETVVRLANAEMEVIDSMVDDGTYIDRSDAIRMLLRDALRSDESNRKTAQERYVAASTLTK